MLRTLVCVAGIVLATASSVCFGDELWRQDPINTVGGSSSQDARNPGGLGWFSAVADNFTAPTAWSITQVEFWGGYVAVDPGHTQGFVIRFYADNNGSVGPLLHTDDNLQFTETVYYSYPPPNNWNGYHYVVNLPQPYTLPAAGSYWISIVAILDRGGGSLEPQWGWAQAPFVTNPPVAEQWFFDPGNFQPNPNNIDMAFVLNGSASGGGGPGVCCRGATCTTAITSSVACEGTLHAGQLAGAEFSGNAGCNSSTSATSPCCYADYNKVNHITVQDIFDFLNDWFAGSPFTRYGSDGSPALLAVQNIFDFLNAWFAGGCG